MNFSLEYRWCNSYLDNDMLWLEDSMNWDNSFNLALSEYNLLDVFAIAAFSNSHMYLDWPVKLSALDIILVRDMDTSVNANFLYTAVAQDYAWNLPSIFFALPFLFHSDFQDFNSTVFHHAVELVWALRDFTVIYYLSTALSFAPAASFDTYQDLTGSTVLDFLDYLTSFSSFILNIMSLIVLARLVSVSNAADAYVSRALFYLNSISVEIRFQLEAGAQVFFFVFLYTSVMIATFDDDQEELLEFFNSMCFYFFLFTLFYYFCKYSTHYFPFLEAAKRDPKSFMPVSQFLFDALNSVAFVLRFVVLMIRLNIYDGVDDILDSYYIFMADFEEEEYFSDTFFSLFSVMSFDIDLNDDRSFLFEDEMDFFVDLFTLYFLIWGKFAYFWLFILEEIARVSLALYVTYLIIFEINAVNRSFQEDSYLISKKTNV